MASSSTKKVKQSSNHSLLMPTHSTLDVPLSAITTNGASSTVTASTSLMHAISALIFTTMTALL